MKCDKNGIQYLRLLAFLLLILSSLVHGSEKEMTDLLPSANGLGPGVTRDYRQFAEGEDLVELINGGAVQFFKHGFNRALFQEYYVDSTQYINVEIYEMKSEEAARGIFMARTDTTEQRLLAGSLGFVSDYFCTFYRDHYYVVITSSDDSEAIRLILLKAARIVDRKILSAE